MAAATSLADRIVRHSAYKTYVTNPVVVRDLRAQMRGTKSFWYQGAFLLLLGILAVAGYAVATGQSVTSLGGNASTPVSIIDAQARLEGFYRFIFLTLAALTTLIAPALTASSIVGERQRLSFDLLVTTPLSAGQMLLGKLISSTAFLVLLLALSLPAAALCVLLGGATVTDLLRSYFLMMVGGLVLSAIGLFYSCAVRTPLLAVIWTYVTVGVYIFGTVGLFSANGSRPSVTLALGALDPLNAVQTGVEGSVRLFGSFSLPIWIITTAAAWVFLRLLLTAAEYRLGVYGAGCIRSLRRQTLFVVAALPFLVMREDTSYNFGIEWVVPALVIGFLGCVPFLINLFVPASAEDAPPGVAESAVPEGSAGYYRFSAALRPDPAGALPFFHIALAIVLCAGIAGAATRGIAMPLIGSWLALSAFYIAALGFLLWAICRVAAKWVAGLSVARAVSFGIFAAIIAVPMMVVMFLPGGWTNSFSFFWILRPLLMHSFNPMGEAVLPATGLALGLGILFLTIERRMARQIR